MQRRKSLALTMFEIEPAALFVQVHNITIIVQAVHQPNPTCPRYRIETRCYRMYGFRISVSHLLNTIANVSANVPIVFPTKWKSQRLVIGVRSTSFTKYCGFSFREGSIHIPMSIRQNTHNDGLAPVSFVSRSTSDLQVSMTNSPNSFFPCVRIGAVPDCGLTIWDRSATASRGVGDRSTIRLMDVISYRAKSMYEKWDAQHFI